MKELYFDRLLPALGIPEYVRCICAAGAGGKTGLLGRLAAEYRDMGKHVLLTTTTKMYLPEAYGALDCSAGEILDRLDRMDLSLPEVPSAKGKRWDLFRKRCGTGLSRKRKLFWWKRTVPGVCR